MPTVPSPNAGREHRAPLTARAISILKRLNETKQSDFAFPGQKPGKPLSNMAMEMVLRRMKIENATVHGFRSTIRYRASNESSYARETAEASLAHIVGDQTEQAYRRGDTLEKRRKLMEEWASYCGDAVQKSSKQKR
ncbi:MAG: hypothetical protein WBF99_03380 [Xanthobacteraceae bacterium]